MPTETGYQGWKNHATWAVALWVDNEEPLYRQRCEMVRAARRHNETDPHAEGLSGAMDRDNAKRDLARALESWIEEMAPDLGATLWSDLLTHALAHVDWYELAESWIDEED